jgi:nucleoside 2-deoxyribosyltransferase
VFISYNAEDAEIALAVRDFIKRALGDACDPFVSVRDIAVGEKWRERLQVHIQTADLVLVLCSPSSIGSAWVMFEAGGAWAQNKTLMPVLINGLNYASLPPPLRDFQHIELVGENSSVALLREIEIALSLSSIPGYNRDEEARALHQTLTRNRYESDYDLYIAIPMSSLVKKHFGGMITQNGWERVRAELEVVFSACREKEELKNYYFAGATWSGGEIADEAASAKNSFDALRRSRRFMMVYPEKVGSGCLVEAGFALALGIPSLYICRDEKDLPFLLRQAGAVVGKSFVQQHADLKDLAASIQRRGAALFPA